METKEELSKILKEQEPQEKIPTHKCATCDEEISTDIDVCSYCIQNVINAYQNKVNTNKL